jgi:hypothetical protein
VCAGSAYPVYIQEFLQNGQGVIHHYLWLSCHSGSIASISHLFKPILYLSFGSINDIGLFILCARWCSQKVLTFCSYPEIYQTLVSEIIEAIVMLALDPFGNYVVQVTLPFLINHPNLFSFNTTDTVLYQSFVMLQHVIEHGGPVERSAIVKKLGGRFLRISYHKHASNVVEKCLAFGSFRDRQLIITEILTAGDLQHFDHLLVSDLSCLLPINH